MGPLDHQTNYQAEYRPFLRMKARLSPRISWEQIIRQRSLFRELGGGHECLNTRPFEIKLHFRICAVTLERPAQLRGCSPMPTCESIPVFTYTHKYNYTNIWVSDFTKGGLYWAKLGWRSPAGVTSAELLAAGERTRVHILEATESLVLSGVTETRTSVFCWQTYSWKANHMPAVFVSGLIPPHVIAE